MLLNQGNNTFIDITASSGLLDLYLPDDTSIPVPSDAATITWAIAMVDYDGDGDIDIMHADDQGVLDNTLQGGIDRSYNQLFQNDGTGQFTNVTRESGLNIEGGWMGLSYGDFNRDGLLDFFSSNFGNYAESLFSEDRDFESEQGDSRWFLQNPDGTFTDPGQETLLHTPFGWGTSAIDYDNDRDTDIIFHGGLDLGPVVITSPGSILNNDGTGNFNRDAIALANSTDHVRRNVLGVATGDLNNDGFVDIVSASSFDIPETLPLVQSPQLGGEWDVDAFFLPTFTLEDPEAFLWSWNGFELPNGTLSVEINNAENGNNSIQVEPLGTVGLTSLGTTNRDGIGAVVSFQPENSPLADMRPILGGSSYASADSLIANFGLGQAESGTVEVLWTGGVRNRLYDVQAGERLVFPEIPVSFTGDFQGINDYQMRVDEAIAEIVDASVLTQAEGERFFASSVRAFMEENEISADLTVGGLSDDLLTGTDTEEHFYGRGGNDTLAGGMGDDGIFGGDGDDLLRGDRNHRSPGGVEGGNDTINGGSGDDQIGGKGGDDELFGSDGDDSIWGDDGDDMLRGGLGDDVLTGDDFSGGEGTDQFILAQGEGTDTIVDFEVGIDLIVLEGLVFEDLTLTSVGDLTRIELGNETLAILEGVDRLSENSFV